MIPPCMMQINAPKFVALSEENLRPRQIPAHRANHWVLTEPGWKRRSAAGLCEEARGAGAEERVS